MTQKYKVSNSYWKNGTHRLAGPRVATNPQFAGKKKKCFTVKYSKAKYDKIKGMLVNSFHF